MGGNAWGQCTTHRRCGPGPADNRKLRANAPGMGSNALEMRPTHCHCGTGSQQCRSREPTSLHTTIYKVSIYSHMHGLPLSSKRLQMLEGSSMCIVIK